MAVANLSSERVVPCLCFVVRTLLVGNGGIEDRGTEAFNCRCTAMERLLSNSLKLQREAASFTRTRLR